MTRSELHWGSNRAAATAALAAGIYGVSNHLLDTPWPKVERTKAAFARWCGDAARADDLAPVFALLRDTERAPDEALPATGVPLEWERMLSAPFIVSPTYGTRCSTVVTIDHDGAARLVERSFDPAGNATGDVDYRFTVQAGDGVQRQSAVVAEGEPRVAVAHGQCAMPAHRQRELLRHVAERQAGV